MTDQPIAFTNDGRPLFDNTPTVVVVVAFNNKDKLIAIRRNNEPGKGLIGLPGGYHMRGETWQEAGAREFLEETGYTIDTANFLQLQDVVTDEYGNNLIVAMYRGAVDGTIKATDGEAQEVLFLKTIGKPEDWAFPRHYAAALIFIKE